MWSWQVHVIFTSVLLSVLLQRRYHRFWGVRLYLHLSWLYTGLKNIISLYQLDTLPEVLFFITWWCSLFLLVIIYMIIYQTPITVNWSYRRLWPYHKNTRFLQNNVTLTLSSGTSTVREGNCISISECCRSCPPVGSPLKAVVCIAPPFGCRAPVLWLLRGACDWTLTYNISITFSWIYI